MPILTEISVRSFKPPLSGQVTHFDDSLAGFGLRVSQGGTKSFVLVHGENRQRTTIGRYPIISLADARTEAKRLLAENTLGKHRPKTIPFDEALTLFLKACAEKNRAKTLYDYTRLLNRHFKFGRTKLNEIATADISRKLGRITAAAERRYATVVIKVFFNWAYREGYVDVSPAGKLQAGQSNSRSRVLTNDELRRVWMAAEQCGTFGVIVRLLILTGQRRGEMSALQSSWIKDNTITLPAQVTKNGREHSFPTGTLTASLLKERLPISQSLLLFPAARKLSSKDSEGISPFNGWSKSKRALDKLADIAPWTLHDLRRTFSTNMAALGVPIHITEKLLNHASGTISGVAAIYNRHAFMEEMRAAVEKHDAYIQTVIAPVAMRNAA